MGGRLLQRAIRSADRLLGVWSAAGRDLVYPPACPRCRKGASSESKSRLCSACRDLLIPVLANRCLRCSAPVGPHLDTTSGCIHCRNERWTFGRACSLGPYADGLREACLRIKRPGTEPLAAALAEELGDQWETVLRSTHYDVIVPVPHHWRQRLWRTQLAPVTLARTLSRRLHITVEPGLVRKVKFTPLQSTLTATERRTNLRNAFRPGRGVRLDGGRILIVDDVLTTGTTADRVARVLRDLGAESIDVAVLARGLHH